MKTNIKKKTITKTNTIKFSDIKTPKTVEEFRFERLSMTTMLSFFKTWKLEKLSGKFQ